MNKLPAIRVVIRDLDGRFLAEREQGWSFTSDITRARVFDYLGDGVAEQLDNVRKQLGVLWAAVPANPRDVCEVCDQCGRLTLPLQAFFDGTRFFCPECRNRARPEPGTPPPPQPEAGVI